MNPTGDPFYSMSRESSSGVSRTPSLDNNRYSPYSYPYAAPQTSTPVTPTPLCQPSNSQTVSSHSLTNTVALDRWLNKNPGLSLDDRAHIHRFAKMDLDSKLTVLYMSQIQGQAVVKQVSDDTLKSLETTKKLKEGIYSVFNPNTDQKETLFNAIKHFLSQPNGSYAKIPGVVGNYLTTPEGTAACQMAAYSTDAVYRKQVDGWLSTKVNDQKSAFAKRVRSSVTQGTGLSEFTKAIIEDFHAVPRPPEPTQALKAQYALLRQVALKLPGSTVPGRDSGFWKAVEEALLKAYSENGNDRNNANWSRWEQEVIRIDEERFARTAVALPAHSLQLFDRTRIHEDLSAAHSQELPMNSQAQPQGFDDEAEHEHPYEGGSEAADGPNATDFTQQSGDL